MGLDNELAIPGVMSPEMVEKFKRAIEQSMGKSLAEQAKARKELIANEDGYYYLCNK